MLLIKQINALTLSTIKGGLRDRLMMGLLLTGFFFLLSSTVFSSFSMRQGVEVSINYGLSVVQMLATLITLFLGLNHLSREIETKSGFLVLTQPLSRPLYIYGKFFGLVALSIIVILFLGVCAAAGILLAKLTSTDVTVINWFNFFMAMAGILMICAVLSATILLFTSIATSAMLPFLMSIAVMAIGFATQPVKKFIESGTSTQEFSPVLKSVVLVAYYIFPNLNSFDFKVYAIYNLPISAISFGYALTYGCCYCAMLLFIAALLFSRRDMA
jgi:ABC-type transport system involved in multi-copper enzyme maturation permease subunit